MLKSIALAFTAGQPPNRHKSVKQWGLRFAHGDLKGDDQLPQRRGCVTRCSRLKYRYSSGRNAFDLINGDHMTERQQRLQLAGARLARGATLIGGGVGLVLFFTTLTGHQRLVFLFLVIALTMPAIMLGLAMLGLGMVGSDLSRHNEGSAALHLTARDTPYFLGAAFVNVLIFVETDAYLALVTMALIGLAVTCGVRIAAGVRPRG